MADLGAAHDLVRERCRQGEWATFAPAVADPGPDAGPADGDPDDADAELPDYDDEDAWRGRTVDGAWLAELVTSSDGGGLHRRGVLLRGARITGGLDLERAELTHQLVLAGCQLGDHRVDLRGARTRLVDLSGSHCGGIEAADVDVAGNMWLRGTVARGAVRLQGATIAGSLECTGARLTARRSTALLLDRADVGGSVVLSHGFRSSGRVLLRDVKIGGNLDCSGARLHAPGDRALDADRSEVAGSLFLHEGFSSSGAVRLVSVRAGGDVTLSGATLRHPGHTALNAARMQVTGSLLFLRAFSSEGRVRLQGASFGGDVHCMGGRFSHRLGPALDGAGLQVAGGLRLLNGTTSAGEVHLRGAAVGGDLDLRGAEIRNPGAIALDARNVRVTGNVSLKDDFRSDGTVLLIGSTVGANVECTGARMSGDAERSAFNVGGSHVEGSIYLNDGFRAEGQVRMLGTVVDGALMCTGATLTGTGGGGGGGGGDGGGDGGGGGTALVAENARFGGTVYLTGGFTSRGDLLLAGATVGGSLECRDARLESPGGVALDLAGARIAGTVVIADGTRTEGLVRLADAGAAALRDDRSSWPGSLDLDGFRYARLDCPPADRGWPARREWLRRQPRPGAQAYLQLAAVYQAAGDELDARKIRIERHNVLLDPPARWRDQLPGGLRGVTGRLWRRLLRVTIGHGFEPARALLIALPLVAAMSLWYGHARQEDMLIPTTDAPAALPSASDCDDDYPCVQPVVYALDNLVPIVDFGQRARWATDQSHRGDGWWDDGRWLAAATWVTSAVGWILATLAAASFTQVIRRE